MPEDFSPIEQSQPPELQQPKDMTMWEKTRICGGLAVLTVGQALVIKGIVDGSMEEVIAADAVALPLGLGIALSVREMRQRLLIVNRKAVDYLKEPIHGPRQQG